MTVGLKPPEDAVVLFDGADLSKWTNREGDPAGWNAEGGAMHVVPGEGDVLSRERFTDFYLHVEFRCPDMPEATGQAKGNSGVYLQGRYEIQVLDSYGLAVPGKGDCGAIYDQFAPLVNACEPPMTWQSYDVVFRAPRCIEGGREIDQNARVTVLQNGLVIQNNVELPGVTGGAMDELIDEPGPVRLQDHGDAVSYRNIWAVHLPLEGSADYEPQ
ncbi:MAG: 3-keto-disaccharide hydrolase [Planctomycetota bacterium]